MVAAEPEDDNADLARLLERAALVQDAGRIGIHDCDIAADRWDWDARVRAMWGIGESEQVTYKTFIEGIHPDDRDRVAAQIEAAVAPGSDGDYLAQYRLRAADGSVRWIEATGRVTFAEGKAARMVGTVRDFTDEKAARDAKEAADTFAQNLIETAPTILYIYDLVERQNLFMGPQIAELTGYNVAQFEKLSSELIATVTHPDDIERIAAHHRAIRSGEAEPPFHLEYRMRGADGRWIWLASTEVVHTRDDDGHPRRILGAALDITARHEAEQERELLRREITHRAQNNLAMVRSIASLTLRPSSDREAWRLFERRLDALATAQKLLAHHDRQSVDLHELIDQTLAPFGGADHDQIELEGPPVTIRTETVMTLTLILHELATNAAKYGALSTPDGRVSVSWTADAEAIPLEWRESGGPEVSGPTRTGFGTQLITRTLSGSAGHAELDFAPAGVVCRLTVRLPVDPAA